MAQFNHLSLSERITIQTMLSGKNNLNSIANQIGRDRRTIAKEILSNRTFVYRGVYGRPKNNCAKFKDY